jgi:hypothetical protein
VTAGALPPLVQRFVERNVPHDQALPATVRLRQEGEMQLNPGRWLPFQAEQDASVERIEFAWRARFLIAHLIRIRVHDWYRGGEGALEVRLLGFPLQRIRGPVVARGEAMRYLAELAWFPYAMVANPELEWHELDEATVEVATQIASVRPAVRLHFDSEGDVVAATADARPRAVGGNVVDTPFRGDFADYQVVGGVRVPTRAEVRWELPEGPFTYFRGQLVDLRAEPAAHSSRSPSASA